MHTHSSRPIGVPSSLALRLQTMALWLCVLVVLTWSSGVFGHASLVSSTPAMGAVLTQAPDTVELNFNEAVSPLVMKFIHPDGAMEDITQTQSLPMGLELALPALAQQGTYGLSWRVISADGHPVGGTLTFSVGTPGTGYQHEASVDRTRDAMIWLSRLGGYIGLFLGVGMAVYHALIPMRGNMRLAALQLLALGAIATVFNVGLLGLDAFDMPVSGLLGIRPWLMAGATAFGLSAALALTAVACAAAVWFASTSVARRILATIALIMLSAALAASGHASTAPPAWLARPAVWMHALAVTLWIGSLVPLAHSLDKANNQTLLKGFSRWIPGVLLILFLSGSVLIYLQFDMLSSLWLTAYGQVLALKLALLTVLLGLGAYNRYRLTHAVLGDQQPARRVMQRVIYVECLLAVAIFATVALWRFTPPPRALSTAPMSEATISAHIHADTTLAELTFAPSNDADSRTLTLRLYSADQTPLTAKEVDVAFSNTEVGVEPIAYSASPGNEGTWKVSDIDLPRLERWLIRIDVLIDDFERTSLETTLSFTE